jgi:hypothetical protein
MRIYDYLDYRQFMHERIKSRPKAGRGELLKIAKHMNGHTTTLSQILGGTRQISLEQAASVCSYFGLGERESRYFLLMVQFERAGTPELKNIFRVQLDEIKKASNELVNLLPHDQTLSDQEKAIFYSNWFYSGVRVLSSVAGYQTVETIAEYFGLPRKVVNEVVGFLVKTQLCIEKNGKIFPGPQYTHLDAGSLLSGRHHSNWRLKAMTRYPSLASDELAYTSPMSISSKDAAQIRKTLVELVEQVNSIRQSTEPEEMFCFNLDWVRVR